MIKRLKVGILVGLVFSGLGALPAQASDLVLGAHLGASKYADLVYGVNVTAHPYDLYGLRLDATFGDGFFSSNPAFIFYPVAYEEMSFGIFGGPGITKATGADLKFGLNVGALGTVKLGSAMEAGIDARYVFPIQGTGGYMIFATFGFIFNVGDSW
jgi:hypothetical protein